MPDLWMRETRASRDTAGVTVVVGSDDEAHDGMTVHFAEAEKTHDWSALETLLIAYLQVEIEGEATFRSGGPDGSSSAL